MLNYHVVMLPLNRRSKAETDAASASEIVGYGIVVQVHDPNIHIVANRGGESELHRIFIMAYKIPVVGIQHRRQSAAVRAILAPEDV